MNKIVVIGAGTMGNGIAHVFAQYGFPVYLVDLHAEQLEKAMLIISKNLDRQVQKGILSGVEKKGPSILFILFIILRKVFTERILLLKPQLKMKISNSRFSGNWMNMLCQQLFWPAILLLFPLQGLQQLPNDHHKSSECIL